MARSAPTNNVPRARVRSREELDEIYRRIISASPKEGPRLVEVHKKVGDPRRDARERTSEGNALKSLE